MYSKTPDFFESIKNKRIALIGAGVSNKPLAKMFIEKGAKVTVCDRRDEKALGETAVELRSLGADLMLGERYLSAIPYDFDLVFRTPGMKYYTEELNKARENGVAVTSEMEMFFELCPCKIFAVTGSDGKTTTTSVIAEMLKEEGETVHLGGNLGRALLPEIENIGPADYAVVELSSFQLISMRKSPFVAVMTNISPNHLDMHKDMGEYINAKKNLFLHQNAFSKTVLNLDNEITASFKDEVRGKAVFFSRKEVLKNGAFLDADNVINYAENGKITKVMEAGRIKIPGVHNVENYLAAISAVWGFVSKETIVKVAEKFPGVEHRIEFVRELDGVKYYNDSIATSPTRTIAGLNSFDRKLIIIAGGYDKNIPFEPLVPVLLKKVKTIVLMGGTAEKIENAIKAHPEFFDSGLKILHAETMEDAVMKARNSAKRDDIISLSPASASFDRYQNFEARGRHFKDIVKNL